MKIELFKRMNPITIVLAICLVVGSCGYKVANTILSVPNGKEQLSAFPINTYKPNSTAVFTGDITYKWLRPVSIKQPLPEIRRTEIVSDSAWLRAITTIAKLQDENQVFHQRAIIASDRRYADKQKEDSIGRLKDMQISLLKDSLKQERQEKQIVNTVVSSQNSIIHYFPLIVGIFMMIAGAIGWAGRGIIERKNQPTL